MRPRSSGLLSRPGTAKAKKSGLALQAALNASVAGEARVAEGAAMNPAMSTASSFNAILMASPRAALTPAKHGAGPSTTETDGRWPPVLPTVASEPQEARYLLWHCPQ